ncbi:Uncharacterised protein [Chryseobacterium taklimakanense]|uniref:Uncharacterized protein n=1 Tax=Chryseobacterium taklimakanense TaxID=536441 RepID=A0A239XYT6_9FLAO|nr:hypothetical protein [Chryseobacterium taklimakanense]SNV51048.1 Uncharacterised protein [Chryseobacterium taklimakanense]
MKLTRFLFFSLFAISCSAQNYDVISKVREKQLEVQNQNNALDFNRVKEELAIKGEKMGPFTYGIFPYPDYDSISKNTFAGIGTLGNFYGIDVNGKKVVYTSFFEGKSKLNKYRIKGKDNVFFTIAVLTDFVDDKEFSSMKSQIVSRNFPDAIGQGYIKTKNNQIDFSAFITIENEQFAIVNMKLYNLKYGKIILIAPQKDGSLRSMQIQENQDLTTENLKKYLEQLLHIPEIIDFYSNSNTI